MTSTEINVEARGAIEAVVLAATEPVPPDLLAQLVEIPTARVEELCDELAAEYEREGRGFQLARVAGGYRFQTHPDAYAYVERFVLEGQSARLSGPSLETLAIVAYKQPIARAQISAIRGVNVDATLKTLVARGYIEESGHEHTPGNPTLFSTTQNFLERLGIDSLADLPPLADFVPESSLVEALERGLRGVDVEVENADVDADVIDVDVVDGAGDAPTDAVRPGETPEQ
jgi:segregation and condensation protein B